MKDGKTRRASAEEILASIAQLEGQVMTAAEDETLKSEAKKILNDDLKAKADAAAAAEKQVVTQSEQFPIDIPDGSGTGGQNDKMMKNWPLSASERKLIASNLLTLASQLIAEEEAEDNETDKK